MRRQAAMAAFVIAPVMIPSCSSDTGTDGEGLLIEAQHAVILSDSPLGDVVVGELKAGDEVTALCFVRRAQTNAGLSGSAVRLRSGTLSGYAAATDFSRDPEDRRATFDLDADVLRDRLPACSR